MDSSILNVPGYTCMRHDRTWMENNSVKRDGGICCYGLDNICTSSAGFAEVSESSKDIEVFWISLTIPSC